MILEQKMLNIFSFLRCLIFYGHQHDDIIEENLDLKIQLLKCVRCNHVKISKMSFSCWLAKISDDERADFLGSFKNFL